LHKDVQECELQGFFKEFGLLQVRLPRDDNGAHRGIAFIDVETQLHAENALVLNKQTLHGR
jgi:RNA recognition motif-containing protein